jgi:hypothetical protein
MVIIGLRASNWPTDEEKAVLLQYVIKTFGGHSASEIKLAFEMAVAGKFNVDVNCYENFSVLYFSSIMNVYRRWAGEVANQITPPVEMPPVEVTDSEFIEAVYNYWKVDRDFKKIPVLAYDVLNLGITSEEKQSIKKHVDTLMDNATPDNYKQYCVKEHFEKRVSNELE